MEYYESRYEQRKVVETMDALIGPMCRYLNEETSELVQRALYLLRELDVKPDKED
jgi:hypothetical protein